MPKALFSQGVALLTDGSTTLGDVRAALERAAIFIARELKARGEWPMWGDALIVPLGPGDNGAVAIDVVHERWPDSMGDPKQEPVIFGAWSTGHFGPFTFPGGLERATGQCWAWRDAPSAVAAHRGFLRVRTSYVFGADKAARVLPDDYDAMAELMFTSRLVLALLDAKGVLAYFNPNGEVLRDRARFASTFEGATKHGQPPLPLWMNIRFYRLGESLAFMDTVGNAQLDVSDIEAVFPSERYQPDDVDYHLRNVTHYLVESRPDLKAGESIDGPGESGLQWRIELADESTLAPPRPIIRLFPAGHEAAMHAALRRT